VTLGWNRWEVRRHAVGGQEELTEPVIEFGQIVRARNYHFSSP
jgi:hypothetical protein